jgi:uncharacterized protein (DUF2141 family)
MLVVPAAIALAQTNQTNADDTGATTAPSLTQITVKITGLHNRRGKLVVDLFDRADDFLRKSRQTQKIDLSKVTALDPLVVTFKDLPLGTYAVSAYQDANENGRLDRNWIGIPKEDWGMSNNPRPWRKPRFNEAKFEVTAPETTITIPLKH